LALVSPRQVLRSTNPLSNGAARDDACSGQGNCQGCLPDETHDPKQRHLEQKSRRSSSGAFCTSQGRAPNFKASVHVPQGSHRRRFDRHLGTPDWSKLPQVQRWHRSCKQYDGNGKRSVDRDLHLCMKFVSNSRTLRNLAMKNVINDQYLLAAELLGTETPAYPKPELRERNMKHAQEHPAKTGVDDSRERTNS